MMPRIVSFVNIKQEDSYPTVMQFTGEKKFDAQTGKDFVAGESTFTSLGNGVNWVDFERSEHEKVLCLWYIYGV